MAEFDWVRARSECSLRNIFLRLSAGIKNDALTRDEIERKSGTNLHFEFMDLPSVVLVTRREGERSQKVEFTLGADDITVDGYGGRFTAAPGYNSTGDCTLIVHGEELELWQVRRKALELLFFTSNPTVEVSGKKAKL